MAKRNSQLTELLVVAQDDYLTIVDTSAGQSKRVSVKNLTGAPDFTWTATGEAWSFSAWNATTRIGIITVPSDATTKYQAGNRVRFSQSTGGTKYGIIVYMTSTTLHVLFMTSITFNNEAISSPVYSALDTPFGFDKDEARWEHEVTLSSGSQASPTINVWYNIGAHALTLGPGKYDIEYQKQLSTVAGAAQASPFVTLSTANNSESDVRMSMRAYPNQSGVTYLAPAYRRRTVGITTKTT